MAWRLEFELMKKYWDPSSIIELTNTLSLWLTSKKRVTRAVQLVCCHGTELGGTKTEKKTHAQKIIDKEYQYV